MNSEALSAPELSIVTPVFNEAEGLPELYQRLTEVLERTAMPFELVFVDDGSTDASAEILRMRAGRDRRVRVIRLARNYGQHSAVMAGLRAARGAVVVTIDADLQNPPEEIPALVDRLRRGYDVVFGVPQSRSAPWTTRLSSWLAHAAMRRAWRLPPGVRCSGFRAMSRPLVDHVTTFTNAPIQLESVLYRCTDRMDAIPTRHAPRHAGATRYDLRRRLRFAMNLFVHMPHMVFGAALVTGLAVAAFGLAVGAYSAWRAGSASGAPWVALTCVLAGVILVLGGFVGECVAQIQESVTQMPQYLVRERIGMAAPLTAVRPPVSVGCPAPAHKRLEA